MKSPVTAAIPPWAVVSIASCDRRTFLNDRLRLLDLSTWQVPVLLLLSKDQNIMQETLVRHYHPKKGTIARSVKKLKGARNIRRIIDPSTRRAVRPFLTGKYKETTPILQVIVREWEAQICAGLSHKECENLRTMIHSVAHSRLSSMKKSGDFSRAEE